MVWCSSLYCVHGSFSTPRVLVLPHALLLCVWAAGMGACVSLNIMWLHVEQASFKMTQQQYREKLDSVAQLVNVLGQTDKVGPGPAGQGRAEMGVRFWQSYAVGAGEMRRGGQHADLRCAAGHP